jgi:hypothetical protein
MKNAKTLLIATLICAVALSALVAPASAQFFHPRGILLTIFPQTIVVFFGMPGNYERNVAVIIKPPWYFVNDFTGFDSVTVTYKLDGKCYQCRNQGAWPKLLGDNGSGQVTLSLGQLGMGEDDNGAWLNVPITFVITSSTGQGYFMLYMSALATSNSLTFYGWDQAGVSINPGYF